MGGRRETPFDGYVLRENGLWLSDSTIGDVSATRHGFTPKAPNDTAKWLRGDATWASINTAAAASVFAPAGPKTPIVDGDFSWEHQGSASYSVSARDGSINMQVAGSATSSDAHGRDKTAPSTPYTVIAQLAMPAFLRDNMGYGLYFRESSSDKAVMFRFVAASGVWSVYIQFINNTQLNQASGVSTVAGPYSLVHTPKFMGIRDDGTNRKYYMGEDEEHLIELYSEGRTTNITANKVGFMMAPYQTTTPRFAASLTVFSWREQSGVPT
jgi:hypothetical protein